MSRGDLDSAGARGRQRWIMLELRERRFPGGLRHGRFQFGKSDLESVLNRIVLS